MAKKRDWRSDAGWWERVREQYRVRGTPTRWAKITGIEKGSLSKYIHGVVALGPENAFAISLAAGTFPRGLLDDDFADAIMVIQRARERGVTRHRMDDLLKRFRDACEAAGDEIAAWDDPLPPDNGHDRPVRPARPPR